MYEKNKSEIEISKAITGLFTVILRAQGGTIEKNTMLLKSIFSTDDRQVSNFRFYYPSGDTIFNFSNLFFTSSKIEGYSNFFDCTFDKDTYFDDSCEIKQVYSTKIKEISAKQNNFSSRLTFDHSLYEIFETQAKNIDFKYAIAKEVLKDFFSIFEERGYFIRREFITSLSKFNKKKSVNKIEFEDIEDILIDKKIIEVERDGHKYLRISNSCKSDVEKFCQENTISSQIDLSLSEIVEDLL